MPDRGDEVIATLRSWLYRNLRESMLSARKVDIPNSEALRGAALAYPTSSSSNLSLER